ncbi:DNA-binding protein [bacterium]|jgi:uncharacterized protein|nr:DNA-binding protein [bacterium]MBT3903361.1 DNA-binding protein [bacterium]MBT4577931.1 DNA-binding protein [bacterium]MBT5345458.1 DNA-binding protein [bacterium]MBT6131152.1 DNA-binding protein [bacterium]
MKTYAFRLQRGQDLRQEILAFAASKNIKAGVILTCVGNLEKAILRMAGAKIVKTWEGTFEITSLVGTFEVGNGHIHITIADVDGNAFGGHLKKGSLVGITAEVVIAELDDKVFTREFDEATGFKEFVVKSR